MYNKRNKAGYILGPVVFLSIIFLPLPELMTPEAKSVAAIAALMAIWWITEAIPIPATALLPVALFPLLGVMKAGEATAPYANHLIFLFLGGFMIAVTMEKWNLHKRIAIHTILIVGETPARIILGFMIASAFLSMWISNTATAMMMVPIGLSVINQTNLLTNKEEDDSFSVSLMLGIGYAASIGGIATIIGTPPNTILAGYINETWDIELGFAKWMLFALPLSILMLTITWIYLTKIMYPVKNKVAGSKEILKKELQELGPVSKPERIILYVFISVALAWILRGFIQFEFTKFISDSTIAILGAVVLFAMPIDLEHGEFMLDWKTAVKIPWDVIILFGGGLSLAYGFRVSALDAWIGNQISLFGIHYILLICAVVLVTIFLTEITSNTATAAMFIPVLAGISISMKIHPFGPIIASAIAASFAFMLPVATPPNAIIFGSKKVTIPQMAKTGFALNIIGWILISISVILFLGLIMGIEVDSLPQWIQ